MPGLSETIDQLAMINILHCYGHVLRIEDGHVLRMALVFRLTVSIAFHKLFGN